MLKNGVNKSATLIENCFACHLLQQTLLIEELWSKTASLSYLFADVIHNMIIIIN